MQKKAILWSVLLSILASGATIFATNHFSSTQSKESSNLSTSSNNNADYYFTSHAQSASLPDFTPAAEKGVAAVVNVEIHKAISQSNGRSGGGMSPFEYFFGPQQPQTPQQRGGGQEGDGSMQRVGGGSGVILSSDGYIITNNHVIDGADKITVTTYVGDRYEAELVGTDPSTDIALLKIEADEPLQFLTFGNSQNLKIGEWVLAVGNPFGLNSTVTAGIVSALGRSLGVMSASQMGIESFIQTDAIVNPGNSGGALITTDGSLVGINTLIKSNTGTYVGYSFAVPANIAQKVVSDIKEFGIVQRALLGISMQEISADWLEMFGEEHDLSEREGVFIAEVSPGGAAEISGVEKGDVLLAIDDVEVSTPSEVQEIIAGRRPGDKVKISIKRDGNTKHFNITLRNRRGGEDLVSPTDVDVLKELGGELAEIGQRTKEELEINGGLQVYGIKPDGLLAKSSIKVGFIITAINDIAIASLSDLNKVEGTITSISGIYPNGRMVEYRAM